MEVPAHLRVIPQRGNHARGHVPRVRAGETNALEAVKRRQTLEQLREITAVVVWGLVVIDDLSQELYLSRSGIHRELGLREYVGDRPHALVSAGVRNDAEGAELVAPLDDRHIRLPRFGPPRNTERK